MTSLEDLNIATSPRGAVITPGDHRYEEARGVYNAMIDRSPAAIVYAGDVADVMAGVNAARRLGLELAIRGGSHSVAGHGTTDGGLAIDLSGLRGIRIDPVARTARVEAGCTWADLDHAAHAFGLATTGGTVSSTGVAGLTLGGGMGFLTRTHGLTCDNLLGADMVTAQGELVSCDEQTNPDLFWALRGGGGNFGAVVSFLFQLHETGNIIGGPTFFKLDAQILRSYRDVLADAPRELGLIAAITSAPALPVIDDASHGEPVVAILACWTGNHHAGEDLLGAMDDWGAVVGRNVGPMPYPVLNTLFDELLPRGLQHYWKGTFARELTDDAIDVHVEHGANVPCPESAVMFFPLDGACQDIAAGQTAFAHRDVDFAVDLAGTWPDPADSNRNIAWVRSYAAALAPHSAGAAYINFTSGDDANRAEANYGAGYGRLSEIKATWDPTNLFHLNQNIKPA